MHTNAAISGVKLPKKRLDGQPGKLFLEQNL
jgi:hypothetical protein